jgi:hypothetical protein
VQRLERTIRNTAKQAPSLPNIWPSLTDRQIAFRRGEVTLIAGQPGAGKSTLALSLAVRANVLTLYCSADTHSHTMSLRLLAMLTGKEQTDIEVAMAEDPAWAEATLRSADHIRWCFDSAPSVATIEAEIAAHETLYGMPPELVVVDNLTDVVSAEGDEWGSLRGLLKDFKWLSREHSCSFTVLHHTSEGFNTPPGFCPPRQALQGKVAATPAVILTVSNDNEGFLGVAPVKNRYGPATPSGANPVWLQYSPSNMQVADLEAR